MPVRPSPQFQPGTPDHRVTSPPTCSILFYSSSDLSDDCQVRIPILAGSTIPRRYNQYPLHFLTGFIISRDWLALDPSIADRKYALWLHFLLSSLKGKISCNPWALNRRIPAILLPNTEGQLTRTLPQRQRWHSLGTCPGGQVGRQTVRAAPHTLFLSSLSFCLSHAPDPKNKARLVSCSRRTRRVYAGRCFLFLETLSGAFFFKSFSLSMWKMLLKVDVIHSTSHFNKKPKFIF